MKVQRYIMKFLAIQKTTKSYTSPAPPTMPSLVLTKEGSKLK